MIVVKSICIIEAENFIVFREKKSYQQLEIWKQMVPQLCTIKLCLYVLCNKNNK